MKAIIGSGEYERDTLQSPRITPKIKSLTLHNTVNPLSNLSVSLNASYRTATPYTITTGRDDNGDGVFNDRPAGTSRNSARGSDSFELGGRLSWGWSFGPPRTAGGGGGGQTMVVAIGTGGGGGGAMASGFAGGASAKRFRVDFYVSAQNILNRTNYTAYSGVLTSPLFGQPTSAGTPRRVQLGARFSF